MMHSAMLQKMLAFQKMGTSTEPAVEAEREASHLKGTRNSRLQPTASHPVPPVGACASEEDREGPGKTPRNAGGQASRWVASAVCWRLTTRARVPWSIRGQVEFAQGCVPWESFLPLRAISCVVPAGYTTRKKKNDRFKNGPQRNT